VTWYDAAAYCNWLSEQEKIPKDQWCYEPNGKREYAEGMKVKANYQALLGYRLPRDAEWEYSAMLSHYDWYNLYSNTTMSDYDLYNLNLNTTMHPVGAFESTPDDTEGRLLKGLRKRCPALPSHDFAVGGSASAAHANDDAARTFVENSWFFSRAEPMIASTQRVGGWFPLAILLAVIVLVIAFWFVAYRRCQRPA
jgi:hypothetical protein